MGSRSLTHFLQPIRRGDPCGRPRAGKSAKRRQWRMKQAGFEEVPRLAGTTVPGNRSAQRWAREPRPYAPSRTHCIGRTGSSASTRNFVGDDAHIVPPYCTPCKNPVIAKPVRTLAVAIRSPRPLCRGITDSHDQSADWSRNDTRISSAPVIARAQRARGNPFPRPYAFIPTSHAKKRWPPGHLL